MNEPSLVDRLQYAVAKRSVLNRIMAAVAATRPGAWLLSKVMHRVDRWMARATKGKFVLSRLGGIPTVWVTTTGRKSGTPRTSPLLATPIDGNLALIGTNFGQRHTPSWVYNLEADPRAVVRFEDRTEKVEARPAETEEREEIWQRAAEIYPGYAAYRRRVTHRDIRIWILEAV